MAALTHIVLAELVVSYLVTYVFYYEIAADPSRRPRGWVEGIETGQGKGHTGKPTRSTLHQYFLPPK